jgi:hypothetical protein
MRFKARSFESSPAPQSVHCSCRAFFQTLATGRRRIISKLETGHSRRQEIASAFARLPPAVQMKPSVAGMMSAQDRIVLVLFALP